MTFLYKGYDKDFAKTKGMLSANSLEEAKAKLAKQKVLVESIREQRVLFARKIEPMVLATLSRNLTLYLKSGISIFQGLRLLRDNYAEKSRVYRFLSEVATQIEEGNTLHDALRNQGTYRLPAFYLQTVRVAETSGNLEGTLVDLAEYIFEQEKIKREVVKAFIYPGFIILIAIAMINFMLTSIIPKILDMFEATKSELPTSTKITLALSNFFQTYTWWMAGISGALIVAFMLFYARSRPFRLATDTFLLKIPFLKTMQLNFELGRFARVMALLLQSGIPFAQAINYAAYTVGNMRLKELFGTIAQQIVEGKSFTQAVLAQKSVAIPKDFVNAVAIGEKSSHMAFSLKSIAELYARQSKDRIDVLLALMEPVLMLVVGGIIGFLVVSMLLPIFSISLQ